MESNGPSLRHLILRGEAARETARELRKQFRQQADKHKIISRRVRTIESDLMRVTTASKRLLPMFANSAGN